MQVEGKQGGELGVDSMRRTDVHVQRMVGGLTAAGLGMTASKLKGNRDERLDDEQSQAESYANMGQTNGSVEDRLDALETQVSQLGQYVSEQVEPSGMLSDVAGGAADKATVAAAGMAAGTVATGGALPMGVLAAGMAGAGIAGIQQLMPDIQQTGKDIQEWAGEGVGNARDRLPKWLGGRADGSGHNNNPDGLT